MSARTVKEDVQASCEDLGLDSNPLQFGFATAGVNSLKPRKMTLPVLVASRHQGGIAELMNDITKIVREIFPKQSLYVFK